MPSAFSSASKSGTFRHPVSTTDWIHSFTGELCIISRRTAPSCLTMDTTGISGSSPSVFSVGEPQRGDTGELCRQSS